MSSKRFSKVANKARKSRHALIAAAVLATSASVANAQYLFWDSDASTANNVADFGTQTFTGMGGAGNWDTTSLNWWDGSSAADQTWTNGTSAVFAQGAGSVTLGTTFNVSSIDFVNTSGGYRLTGGTINLGSAGINIDDTGTTQHIDSVIAGGDLNILKNNANTTLMQLTLGGNNTFTGNVNINSASTPANAGVLSRLNLDTTGALPATATVNFYTTYGQIVATGSATTNNLNMNATGSGMFNGSLGANSGKTLTVNGIVSGLTNISFQSGSGGGGGTVVLNQANTWTGSTTLNTATSGTSKGFVVLGVDNALPTNTDLIIGSAGNSHGTGALDLNGHNQSINSLSTGIGNTGISQGIASSGASTSTLTITGSLATEYDSTIGVPTTGVTTGYSGAWNDNIAVNLSNTHTGSLNLTAANTYSGGTTINGGTLLINNTTGSGTGSGNVNVGSGPGSGAVFGGSGIASGAVVVNGGKLIPGGIGATGTLTVGTLSLNPFGNASGASADFDFTTTSADNVATTAMALPVSGTENLNFTFAGGVIANGIYPLFSGYLGTLSAAQFATLSYPTSSGGASFLLLNNSGEVDLQITGGKDNFVWKGPAGGSGTWDVNTTANWSSLGVSAKYTDNAIATLDDTANGTGPLTVTISNGGVSVKPYAVIFNNSSKDYIIDGTTGGDVIGGSAFLVKNGTGAVTFNKVQSYTGDTTVNAGTINFGAAGGLATSNLIINDSAAVNVAAGGTLGAGNVTVGSGGTLSTSSASALASSASLNLAGGDLQYAASFSTGVNPIVSGSSTIDTGANNVTFTGAISSATSPGNVALTKIGTGSLTLATPASGYTGGWQLNEGTVILTADDGSGLTGLGTGSATNYNTNSLHLNSGATLQLNNTHLGNAQNDNAPEFFMEGGSTLAASGASSFGRLDYAWDLASGTEDSPISMTFKTINASDTLEIDNSIQHTDYATGTTGTFTTLHVQGPGTVILTSGGVSSDYTFAGNWSIDSGILQVGPVVPNTPGTSGNGGPYGEPLNALGFIGGDPDTPVPVTVNTGGVLALAVDAPNANPNTTGPVNPTPSYLRNPITLAGGALAATGEEVSYDTGDPNGPQGYPTGVKVVGKFGGALIVTGNSKILTYNPQNPTETRTVQLVGGSRTITNDSPNHTAGDIISYDTSWNGNLEVDPGLSGGGEFDIIRDAGNVSVTPGAAITVDAGAGLVLGGAADTLSDGTNHVNVINNSTSTFHITQGTKNIASLSGVGNTLVDTGVSLITNGITQNDLNVADGGKATVRSRAVTSANSVSYLNTLNLNSTGTLDLNDNDLVVNSGDFSTIQALVLSGHASTPTPGKTGIISTVSQNTGGKTILELVDNSLTGYVDWPVASGHAVDTNAIIGKYTYYGDTNLDGAVTGDDYSAVDANLGSTPPAGKAILLGDTNFDGAVTGDDYSFIDADLGLGVGNQLAVSHLSAVPEPTSLSLIGLGAAGFLARRRRRKQR